MSDFISSHQLPPFIAHFQIIHKEERFGFNFGRESANPQLLIIILYLYIQYMGNQRKFSRPVKPKL